MEANIYILRAKPHGIDRETEFLEGSVSLGFPNVGDLTGLSQEQIREIADKNYDDQPLSGIQLTTFAGIRAGAILIVPSPSNPNNIHFLEATSDYFFLPENCDDDKGNPHTVTAKHLRTLQRATLPAELIDALRVARKSVTAVPRLQQIVAELLRSLEAPPATTTSKAIAALETLLGSSDESVRLQAAIALLAHSDPVRK
jgi:predicted Mrr-cat superfamily restriction endonuclease